MKANVVPRFGPPDIHQMVELPDPVPAPDEVLIRVTASSINPLDCKIRDGSLAIMVGRKFPKILGCDVAGVVEQLGAEVKNFKVGDRVFGLINTMGKKPGAFAEKVAVAAHRVAAIPTEVSDSDAATLPCAALAALVATRDHGKVAPGMKVLVNGASGGVGTFVVQLSRNFGGEVTAVCSGRNAELVRGLGASHVVDYTKSDFTDGTERYDVIVEVVGKTPYSRARRVLRKGGAWVSVAVSPGVMIEASLRRLFGTKMFIVQTMPAVADLPLVADMLAKRKIEVVRDSTFALSDLAKAHAVVESGRARGKVVVTVP